MQHSKTRIVAGCLHPYLCVVDKSVRFQQASKRSAVYNPSSYARARTFNLNSNGSGYIRSSDLGGCDDCLLQLTEILLRGDILGWNSRTLHHLRLLQTSLHYITASKQARNWKV
mmetsp:Transcript_5219/g.7748  ORF Transcript_5219/g.7748 Transcript_5219/m.7748 type:complete len:114 (+) Transcript_5219:1680-2021(+)